MPQTATKPRWTTRRKAWTGFILANALCLAYMLWMAFGPPPGMPISPETTRFTGPIVGEYGLNTYAAVWEAKGWPREKAPHEWLSLIHI